MQKADWKNSQIIATNVVEEISRLKTNPGGSILVAGSRRLVDTLIKHNLVDEFRLMVYPVILGEGKRLFNDGSNRLPMKLVEARPVGAGILILVYRPVLVGSNPAITPIKNPSQEVAGEKRRSKI
jgi:dihydrofolate reductase